jgi:hypothetical protein
MIHKVFIVRCSFCHGSLRDRLSNDYRPRYFYDLNSIQPTLIEAGWKTMNGTEICPKCLETYNRSEL